MKLYQRYLFKTLCYNTLGIASILTAIIWLMQSLRFARAIMHHGISVVGLFELCIGSLPRTVLIIVPIAFLLATLWCYNRIIQDNERDVISACGVWPWFFAWPCIKLSFLLILFLYSLSLYFSPVTVALSKKREFRIHHYLDPSFIAPGVFFQVEERIFYVHRQKNKKLFEGIFIYDSKDPNHQTLITGKDARVIPKDNGFEIHLQQGTRQQIFSNKPPSVLSFKEYSFRFGPKNKEERKRHVQEMGFLELISLLAKGKSYQAELYQRLFLPLLPLMDSLWVTLILLYFSGVFLPSILAVVLVSGMHLCVFYYLPLSLWLILLGCLGWLLTLFFKRY